MVQLLAIDGNLHYPVDPKRKCVQMDGHPAILLCVYPEGDCDAIRWPNPNRDNLHRALFDDRERGLINDEEVLLPDGTSAWK